MRVCADTHSRLELFQYTACRLLGAQSGKLQSASARMLRESEARAIIRPVRSAVRSPARATRVYSIPRASPLPRRPQEDSCSGARSGRLRILTSHFHSGARVRGGGHARPHVHAGLRRSSAAAAAAARCAHADRPPIRSVLAAPRPLRRARGSCVELESERNPDDPSGGSSSFSFIQTEFHFKQIIKVKNIF